MTAIEQFIEDAIKGGWRNNAPICVDCVDMKPYVPDGIDGNQITLQVILLDPLAWKAAYGTDYATWVKDVDGDLIDMLVVEKWKVNMHRFIDQLADGKSIEEALAFLTPNSEVK